MSMVVWELRSQKGQCSHQAAEAGVRASHGAPQSRASPHVTWQTPQPWTLRLEW